MTKRVTTSRETEAPWLADGGKSGAVVRSVDWSKNPLGPVSSWPQSLRTAVNLCLVSSFPSAVIWGPQRTQIYNDAYSRLCSDHGVSAIGRDFKTCRSAEWDVLEPELREAGVGKARESKAHRVFTKQDTDYWEENFFDFSFAPIHGETGEIDGVFHLATDTTQQNLTDRRSSILRDITDNAAGIQTVEDAGELLAKKLAKAQADLPFFLLYNRDPGDTRARLVVNVGCEESASLNPESLDLVQASTSGWPLELSLQYCKVVEVSDLSQRFGQLRCGPYPESPRQAVIMPVAVQGTACPLGIIIAGVSARRPLDDLCRTFYQQLRDTVTSLLNRTHAYTEESRRRETALALQNSEERYRAIVESQTEMICRFRSDGTILFVNEAWARGIGIPASVAMGENIWDLVGEEDRSSIIAQHNALRPDSPLFRIEYPAPAPGSQGERWVLWTTCGLEFDRNGRPGVFQSCGVDITDRKRAEEALRASEERLRIALQGAHAGAWSRNIVTGEADCSPEMPVLYGYPPSTQPNYDQLFSRVHSADGEVLRQYLHRRVESDARDFQHEFRIVHPERGLRWILDIGCIERDSKGKAVRLTGINMDVTERKQAEEALRESETKFRRLAEAVPTMVWVCQHNGSVTYANRRWTEYTGQGLEDARGFGWIDVIHPDDLDRTRSLWKQSLKSGTVYEGEVRYRRRDGQYRWHRFKALPWYDEGGGVSEWYGASIDVEEQKAVEHNLRESERHFRTVADAAPAILWMTSPDGACSFISRGWYEFTGQTPEEAEGFGWLDVISPKDRERVNQIFMAANSKREEFAFDYRIARADGEYRWVIDAGRPRFHVNGEFLGYVGSVIDVHERKQAEETLRDSEERFHTLADNMSQLAWMADADGSIFWFNRRWYEYTGASVESMHDWAWTRAVRPDYADSVKQKILHSFEAGEGWEDLVPLHDADGNYRWFLSRALPIRDERGTIIRWLDTKTDITDQQNAEQALKEADRRKNEFLATLAHELRNPLAPIRNGLQIMQLASHDPESVERARTMMERQFEHMVRLIDDLLDLSRISRGKITLHKERVELAAVIRQAVETSRPGIEEHGHELTVSLPPETLWVNADPTRLSQVFANLLNNAAKFTDRSGQIWVTVDRRNGEVCVSVRDNGIGIPSQSLPDIFDMFIQADPSLERSHGGLGIGLSLVKGLVEMHEGGVEAKSDGTGLGSEFIVRLPLLISDIDEAKEMQEQVEHKRRRILVVDDNRDSAASMATMLELMDNETATAHDGLEALGAAASFRPDVILLDIGMPKLNGYDVARKIREHDWGRDMVLVALTGWGQEEDRRRSQEAGINFHLVKPVELSVLQNVLGKQKGGEE